MSVAKGALPLITDVVGGDSTTKTGVIYTTEYGIQPSKSIELTELANGLTLDAGATKKQLFAGVSKDILSDVLDIGVGLATDLKQIEPYIGIHFRF